MSYLGILAELVIGYFSLFITVKFLGKTQLSQITPFDFISALVLGDLVGGAIFDKKAGIVKIIFAVAVWGTLIYVTELATQKSRRMRYILEGRPSVIINKGKLDWNEMKINRLDVDQLQQMLRAKDIFSMKEVDYAIFENNGALSVLKKANFDQPSCQDLKIKGVKRKIPLTIISDGEVLFENLQKAGLTEEWLQRKLEEMGINIAKEISYAEWESGDSLYIQKYNS